MTKAAFLQSDKTFAIHDTQPAEPAAGQVSINVAWCGICGTDLHIVRGHMDQRVAFPQVIGHEMSGTIKALGQGVDNLKIGDPVVVRPLDPCGKCGACLAGHPHICYQLNFIGIDSPGAFQSSFVVPAHTVHRLPANLDLRLAALIEPLAVACHDNRLGETAQGETAVVLGGGPIGMLNALVAQHRGANVLLSEINPARLALAKRFGFQTINPSTDDLKSFVDQETAGRGADIVFEVSGAKPAIADMTDLACARGRIIVVAIVPQPVPVDLFKVFWRELRIIGTRVYEPQDYEEAISLAASGALPLSDLITAERPLSEIQQAFAELNDTSGNHAAIKTLLQCG